jgi:hypothetical protein
MLPFGVTIPATVLQRSEIPMGLMNYPVLKTLSPENQETLPFEVKSKSYARASIVLHSRFVKDVLVYK